MGALHLGFDEAHALQVLDELIVAAWMLSLVRVFVGGVCR